MSEWYPEAERAIELCGEWADAVGRVPILRECELYLFGSAIYERGEQFDGLHSDLDIVCVIPDHKALQDRLEFLRELRERKLELELLMIRRLHRTTCSEPGVSVVPLTAFEISANIHKSGARSFFDKNLFYNLNDKSERLGLHEAGRQTVPEPRRQAMEYCQKIRNSYLAVAANDTGGLIPYAGADPLPKALARSAAQISPGLKDGEWYDTRKGLDHLFRILGDRQGEHSNIEKLYRRVSIRRGGRGQREPLTPFDQLTMAELLFEESLKGEIEKIVRWDLHIEGDPDSVDSVNAAVAAIEKLAPQVRHEGTQYGSIVLRMKGPRSAFDLVEKLYKLGVLSEVLGFTVIALRLADENSPPQDAEGRVGKLLRVLEAWNVPEAGDWLGFEERLAGHLRDILGSDSELTGAQLTRNVRLDGTDPSELDFLLRWSDRTGRTSEAIGIEVTTSRTLGSFFAKVSRFLDVGRPLILVFVLPEAIRGRLATEASRLERLNPNIHVVIHTLVGT